MTLGSSMVSPFGMPDGEELYQEVSEAVRKSWKTKQRLEDGRKKDATMLRRATGIRTAFQETKEQPTRVPPCAVCCFHTGLRLTRTGGRIGTCSTANRFSGRSSWESSSMATPPKPRSRTRARNDPCSPSTA